MAAVARALHRTHATGTRSLNAGCTLAPASPVWTLAVAPGRCGHRTASIWAGRDTAQRGNTRTAVGVNADQFAARWAFVGGELVLHDAGELRSEAPVDSFHETSLRLALGGGHEGSAARGRAERGLMQLFAELDTPGILRVEVPPELPEGAREGPERCEERLHDESRPYGTRSKDLPYLTCSAPLSAPGRVRRSEGRKSGSRACLRFDSLRA